MESLRVREAEGSDIEPIILLLKQDNLYFDSLDNRSRLGKQFNNSNEHFLVADLDGKVVGVVFGSSGWRPSINHLGVSPNYQRRGIGTKLFNSMIEKLKNLGIETVLVDSNLPKRFWEKLGCKYRGTFDNYKIKTN